MPDVYQMVRQAPRRNQYHIDPHIFRTFGVAWVKQIGRRSDAAQARVVDGERQVAVFPPRFHLDKRKRFPAPCDQIHFTARGFDALTYDAPALQT